LKASPPEIPKTLFNCLSVYNSFPVSGQYDAVTLIEVNDLSEIKDITTKIQTIQGVERTETMVEVQ